jgi:hypothetical protein
MSPASNERPVIPTQELPVPFAEKVFRLAAFLGVSGFFCYWAYQIIGWGAVAVVVVLVVTGFVSESDLGRKLIVPLLKIGGTAAVVIYAVRSMLPLKSVGEFILAVFLAAVIVLVAAGVFHNEWFDHG